MGKELLFKNARVWRSSAHKMASWMTINKENGYVTGTGDGAPPACDDSVDVGGKVILPGFHEAHIHVGSLGKVLCGVDLAECKTIEAALKMIKEFKARKKNVSFIEAYNLNDVVTGRLPTREELDEACPDRPILVFRVCIHIGVVNSAFIKKLGLGDSTPNPDGGVIDRYPGGHPKAGQINGCLKETALDLARDIVIYTDEERLEHLRAGLDFCLKQGVTSVHSNEPGMWNQCCTLADSSNLPIRVFMAGYYTHRHGGNFPEGPQVRSEFLSCDRIKLFTDGSLGGFTAGLSQPYIGQEGNKGILLYTQDEFNKLASVATAEGFRLEIHAIGDAAADMALDGIEYAGVSPEKRPILTHCQILREDQLLRMRDLGVVANIQPSMLVTDCQWLAQRVPGDLLKFAYAWKSIAEKGIVCAGGSDAPVEEAKPLLGMYDAIYRQETRRSDESHVFKPEEKYNLKEAIDLYTVGGAWATRRENDLGKLFPGYKADFVILNTPGDLFKSPELLLKTEVEEVWVNAQKRL